MSKNIFAFRNYCTHCIFIFHYFAHLFPHEFNEHNRYKYIRTQIHLLDKDEFFCFNISLIELCVHSDMKTIKPINVGGLAGGLKYVCQNIFFKFALDVQV